MISDTNEKTEPPPPLTQREMAQFVTLSTMPTLERALERLRWLEAEVVSLKAQRDEAFKSAINAALRADDHNADPLAEMWAALAEYQPQADRDGHGESWRRMCSERTEAAALAASRVATWVAARAAGYAARSFARDAACAVAEIRRAKEGR